MRQNHGFGLELTNNSKTGWAFSLSRNDSCIHATDICRKLCYGNGIRYQSAGQKDKRRRNFKTVEFLLERGGPELLAENLIALVDQARPSDWLAAQICDEPTSLPWSLRIHDVGDFHSVDYVSAWIRSVAQRPKCKFWFYTRSFADPAILAALSELASFANCSGLLSIDSDNFELGLQAFAKYPGTFKLALLQEHEDKLDPALIPAIESNVTHGQIVNFPYHHGGRHVPAIQVDTLTNCPQITTKALPLQAARHLPKPCQSCSFCLPL
jgi:hypothetical protein